MQDKQPTTVSNTQNQQKSSQQDSHTANINKKQQQKTQKIQSTQSKHAQNTMKKQQKLNEGQNSSNIKQGQKLQKQSQMKQQKQQNRNINTQIYRELLDMGFQQYLIKQALKITTDKDKAIEYIISSLENEQKILQKTKQKNKQKQMNMQERNDKKQKKQGQKLQQGVQGNDSDFEDQNQDYKMLFLVRMDLKMGLGKIAAQVAHATLKAYKQMQTRADKNQIDQVNFFEWMQGGQKKIVVKVNDEKQLTQTLKKASQRDAGLTQVASGSITVGALGPAPGSQIDALTKHFKLL